MRITIQIYTKCALPQSNVPFKLASICFKYTFDRVKEEFEDTKLVIRIHISKKNTQHNGQKKKYKRTNIDQQNIHIKLKIE
jgi:hypothetical protein